MTATYALFVRIRTAEGKYLGGDVESMNFFDDINKAIIFDCRRDHIEQQLEHIRLTQGIVLEVVPIDPKEIHETCDRCGRLVFSFQAFYDGEQYLCGECRSGSVGGRGRTYRS
jgi:hypothetical protein